MLRRTSTLRDIAFLACLCAAATAGCADRAPPRNPIPLDRLVRERAAADARLTETYHALMDRLVARARAEQDDHAAAGSAGPPPAVDVLVVSGGGDWGAFGAGVLKGWGRVAGPLARPRFDAVTGVSTGALIAPFAYLGDDASIDRVVTLYRNPQKDWAVSRGRLFFLPGNPSFATVGGLEQEMRRAVDAALLRRVAAAENDGRILLVNTTDVDDGIARVWDVAAEARRAVAPGGDPDRVRQILLASAAIPGVFPSRLIDDRLYVDGAVTGNILYGGRARAADTFHARWAARYPADPVPIFRYWVIFNNQFRFLPQVTEQTWPAVIGRSTPLGIQAATVNSMRHLVALAEVERLKRGAAVEVRIIAVPEEWVPPVAGPFQRETMNALADLGERMGADPASWRAEPP